MIKIRLNILAVQNPQNSYLEMQKKRQATQQTQSAQVPMANQQAVQQVNSQQAQVQQTPKTTVAAPQVTPQVTPQTTPQTVTQTTPQVIPQTVGETYTDAEQNNLLRTTGTTTNTAKPPATNSNDVYKDYYQQQQEYWDKIMQAEQEKLNQKLEYDKLQAELQYNNSLKGYEQSKLDVQAQYEKDKAASEQQQYDNYQAINAGATERGISHSPQALGLEVVMQNNTMKKISEHATNRDNSIKDINQKIAQLKEQQALIQQGLQLGSYSAIADLNINRYNQQSKTISELFSMYNDKKREEENRLYQQQQEEARRKWEVEQAELEWKRKQEQDKADREWQKEYFDYQQDRYDKSRSTSSGGGYSGGYSRGGYSRSYTPYSKSYSGGGKSTSSGNDDALTQATIMNEYKRMSTDQYNKIKNSNMTAKQKESAMRKFSINLQKQAKQAGANSATVKAMSDTFNYAKKQLNNSSKKTTSKKTTTKKTTVKKTTTKKNTSVKKATTTKKTKR